MQRTRTDQDRLDLVGLGEVMLRLDPGRGRIRSARQFTVWEGGGEYNVVRGAATAFSMRTAIVTALADDEVGRLVEGRIAGAGVGTDWIRWVSAGGPDGARNGINFTERGAGVRGALGVSDRSGTAVSRMRPEDVDWDRLFERTGARWLHTGGVFAGLSETTARTAHAAMTAARRHGVTVSYDANYRASLWARRGGIEAARAVCRELGGLADVFVGNEFDLLDEEEATVEAEQSTGSAPGPTADQASGSRSRSASGSGSVPEHAAFRRSVDRALPHLPHARLVVTTQRVVRSASRNDWGASAWSAADGVVHEPGFVDLEIVDRVGGGDSFCSGLIASLLAGASTAEALRAGVVHGALAMTTPGDTSAADHHDVAGLSGGRAARVDW